MNKIVEYNHKRVNDILLQSFANNSILYNSKSELISIAEQCPYEDGNAVYRSRVMLSQFDTISYQNICEVTMSAQNSNKSLTDNQIINSLDYIFTYPQPVKDQFIIEYSENYIDSYIKIYNLLGEEITSFKLSNKEKSIINLKDYKTGVYFYKIQKESKLLYTNKIIKAN